MLTQPEIDLFPICSQGTNPTCSHTELMDRGSVTSRHIPIEYDSLYPPLSRWKELWSQPLPVKGAGVVQSVEFSVSLPRYLLYYAVRVRYFID